MPPPKLSPKRAKAGKKRSPSPLQSQATPGRLGPVYARTAEHCALSCCRAPPRLSPSARIATAALRWAWTSRVGNTGPASVSPQSREVAAALGTPEPGLSAMSCLRAPEAPHSDLHGAGSVSHQQQLLHVAPPPRDPGIALRGQTPQVPDSPGGRGVHCRCMNVLQPPRPTGYRWRELLEPPQASAHPGRAQGHPSWL